MEVRGGGGSSGGSNTSTAPVLNGLSADPTTLSGSGYTAKLVATLSDPDNVVQSSHFSWSCVDTSNEPCPTPNLSTTDARTFYWTAPNPADTGPYTLTLTLDTDNHPVTTQSVTVNVAQGSQNVSVNDSDFAGGQ